MGKHRKEDVSSGVISGNLSNDSVTIADFKKEWLKRPEKERMEIVTKFLKDNNLYDTGK